MRTDAKWVPGYDEEPTVGKDLSNHKFQSFFDHDQKGFSCGCSCGWLFQGFFSNKQVSMDNWFKHSTENSGERIAAELAQREETARKARDIVAQFTKRSHA